MNDPGLVRLLLHKGETWEKITALGVANSVMELRRHDYTTRFLSAFHNALHGKRPGFLMRWKVGPNYRPLVDTLDEIAKSRRKGAGAFEASLCSGLPRMFNCSDKLFGRARRKEECRVAASSHIVRSSVLQVAAHRRSGSHRDPQALYRRGLRSNHSLNRGAHGDDGALFETRVFGSGLFLPPYGLAHLRQSLSRDRWRGSGSCKTGAQGVL
jgi:hypothetical protein